MWSTLVKSIRSFIESQTKKNEVSLHILSPSKVELSQYEWLENFVVSEWIDKDAEIIILAVKSDQLKEVNLQEYATSATLVSVLAWTSVHELFEERSFETIVRLMPNLLMNLGKSTTWWFMKWEKNRETELLTKILESSWTVLKYDDERKLHAHTALFGSWPWVISRIIQDYIDIAIENDLWLSQDQIEGAVLTMFSWVTDHLLSTNTTPNQFFSDVASKWWTTEAFWNMRNELWWQKILSSSLDAATQRSMKKSNK